MVKLIPKTTGDKKITVVAKVEENGEEDTLIEVLTQLVGRITISETRRVNSS